MDESGKNVYGLAQIRVVPPAEKCSSKVVSLVKACANQMGQRGFSDSGRAIDPVCIPLENILLTQLVGHPICYLIEKRLAGAVHAAKLVVIACLNRHKMLEQKFLIYSLLLQLLLL